MDTKARKFVIAPRGTLPGVGAPSVPRTISIKDLEQELADEQAFDELETGETVEMPAPRIPGDDEDTNVYEIVPAETAADVYWIPLV